MSKNHSPQNILTTKEKIAYETRLTLVNNLSTNYLIERNADGRTPLEMAIFAKLVKRLDEKLLEALTPNQLLRKNEYGECHLELAIYHDCLLDLGAKVLQKFVPDDLMIQDGYGTYILKTIISFGYLSHFGVEFKAAIMPHHLLAQEKGGTSILESMIYQGRLHNLDAEIVSKLTIEDLLTETRYSSETRLESKSTILEKMMDYGLLKHFDMIWTELDYETFQQLNILGAIGETNCEILIDYLQGRAGFASSYEESSDDIDSVAFMLIELSGGLDSEADDYLI